ncbi:MAG: hypothetical protein PWP27_1442 [Clostridiales bacterium]|jgi:phosphopantothenoylcysteine synthetase/decarboxylase|nr:hypothetical protein [Clostridiales bacterium]MDK2933632.1 hypothetical protein [Clostridiales bacterium]
MKTLVGELIKNNRIIDTVQMTYQDHKGFFIALVNICDELKVDIPIWTAKEDKLLDRKGEVLIALDKNTVLRIWHNHVH